MELLQAILTVAAIAAIGIMSPGPDFFAVTYASMLQSRLSAFWVALGVICGNGIWAGAALLGVGALFALFPTFYLGFKIFGALYLCYLGIKMLRSARQPLPENGAESSSNSVYTLFSKGLATTMSNPKAAVYYASALSAAAPQHASWATLMLLLATVVLVATVWFSLVILVLSTPKASAAFRRFKAYFESLFGGLLLTFGLKRLWDAKP